MHRVRQFGSHIRARVTDDETALAHRILPVRASRLFDTMPPADRRHALDVVERLLVRGHDDPELLAAALLHDAAKGRRLRLWHRVAAVVLEAIAPTLLRRLASPNPGSWRHAFHLYLHHADLSAELALANGCSPRTAAFIRGTPTNADVRLGRALKAADDAS